MHTQHDPYLSTVQITLKEEKLKRRQKKYAEKKEESKSYLSQKINFDNILDLPTSMTMFIFSVLFLVIPYSIGMISVKILQLNLLVITTLNSYLLLWTIGYELSATLFIVYIIKESFCWKKESCLIVHY